MKKRAEIEFCSVPTVKHPSSISYADYASAMMDVIESGKHDQERISVFQD